MTQRFLPRAEFRTQSMMMGWPSLRYGRARDRAIGRSTLHRLAGTGCHALSY